MRKPASVDGTLFSFDTASLGNAELALSFENNGAEMWVYNAGEKAKFPNLSLNVDNWIVLGFSWSWSAGNMSYKISIDNDTDTLTISGLPPYMDTAISSHVWGNSRQTQFGVTRLFETFLEVYIHSIHIRNRPGLWPPHADHSHRIPGLWTCEWNSFFDEATQGCLECHSSCSEGCIRPTGDNCKCFDIECRDCVDSLQGSDCRSCGLLTSFARGSDQPCDCKLGFSRDTSNGGEFTNSCSLDIEIPCIGAAPRCNNCIADTGSWFGDCLSCG